MLRCVQVLGSLKGNNVDLNIYYVSQQTVMFARKLNLFCCGKKVDGLKHDNHTNDHDNCDKLF